MGEEFFSNRELFEKIEELKNDINDLRKDMEATRTLIRDYNGLRQKVENTTSKVNTLMWAMPVTISIIGIIFTILNYVR